MERSGDHMSLVDGICHGKVIWCDPRGSYQVDNQVGTSDFFFHKESETSVGELIIRCKKWRRPVSCPVRAKLRRVDGEILRLTGVHNHPPEFGGHGSTVLTARGDWLRKVRRHPEGGTTEAILEERRRLPMEAASQIIVTKNLRTAQRQATSTRPKDPKSLWELHLFVTALDLPKWTRTVDDERLISIRCPNFDSVVLTTRRQLSLFSSATTFQADATYKVVRGGFCEQLLTIHGNWGGYVGMVAAAFMQQKSTDAYVEVFRAIKGELPGLAMTNFMGDFDGALRAAVHLEFPDARILGCWFHFAQCLVKRVKTPVTPLASQLRSPGPMVSKYLAFFALPLLPGVDIQATFDLCEQEALNISPDFEPFVNYFRGQWLETIGPARLSLYRAPCRTNNAVESSNASLKSRVGTNAATWSLIATLVNIAQDVAIDLAAHARGEQNLRSRPARDTIRNDRRIASLWNHLDAAQITPKQFIDRAKYRLGASLAKRALFSDEEQNSTEAREFHAWIAEQDALLNNEEL